jgi:hypothetical protein
VGAFDLSDVSDLSGLSDDGKKDQRDQSDVKREQDISWERLLRERAPTVCRNWLDKALLVYSNAYRQFAGNHPDTFANPAGMILKEGLAALFEALVEGAEPERCRAALTPVIRLRAVQEMPPSQALAFVTQLKSVVREVLGDRMREGDWPDALLAFEAQIDQAALWAFDIYSECREKIFELRVNEMKRNRGHLWRRMRPQNAAPLASSGPTGLTGALRGETDGG